MELKKSTKVLFGIAAGIVLLFIYAPLAVVLINSVNGDATLAWPVRSVTFEWWGRAFHSAGLLSAALTSFGVAIVATIVSLILGTLCALALQRYDFFGKSAINMLVILPIALPGIVAGIALNNAFTTMVGIKLSMFTLIVAHVTFTIVTVYNNVFARLGQLGQHTEEASADLGAGVWTTFRLVTFPRIKSSLFAGGLLAFALSFDEIVVTTFTAGQDITTLPIWIMNNMFRPHQAPVVSVVAVIMVVISLVPLWLSQRVASDID